MIERLPSGRYRARYTHNDERFSAPTTFDTKGDARAYLTDVRSQIQRGLWQHPSRAAVENFAAYAKSWIDSQLSKDGEPLRPRTRAEYLRYLDKGLSEFADTQLTAITPADVRAWHAKRSKSARTAAAREARLLRAVLNSAVEDSIIVKNPVDGKLCRSSAGLKHRPPTNSELASILATFETESPQLRLAVLLAAYGGLRLSEWRALQRRDLELVGGRYVVQVTRQAQRTPARLRKPAESSWMVGPPKSAEGIRVVTLPEWMTEDISQHLKLHVARFENSLIFQPARSGEFLDDKQFNRPWNIARDRLGIRGIVREHDLRAFAATYYVRAGATMREVQQLLGHGSTEAALAYQHAVGDRSAELADRMPKPANPPARPSDLASIRDARNSG